MKLVEFKEKYGRLEKKETLIDEIYDGTYYKLMTIGKTNDYDLSCYANFDDFLYIEKKDGDFKIIASEELGRHEKTQNIYDMLNAHDENQYNLENLIYNGKLLNKKTRKYKLKNIGETALFGTMLALPVATGIMVGDSMGVTSGIASGAMILFGEIATFSLINDGMGHYGKDFQDQKKLSIEIEKNSASLDEAYIKKILFEPSLYKGKENLILMEYVNKQRNKLLDKPDEFSESTERFIRKRKK